MITLTIAVHEQQRKTLLLSVQLCRECFYEVFEQEVHQTIIDNKLFKSGEKVAIGASGMLKNLRHAILLSPKKNVYSIL